MLVESLWGIPLRGGEIRILEIVLRGGIPPLAALANQRRIACEIDIETGIGLVVVSVLAEDDAAAAEAFTAYRHRSDVA